MIGEALPHLLLPLLLLAALAIHAVRSLFAAVVLTGIFSLLTVALFVSMDAVDVALTEAVVGVGIAVVLLLGSLALTGGEEHVTPGPPPGRRLLALAVCLLCVLLLCYGSLDMPPFGAAAAPVHSHLSPRYLGGELSEVPNAVTAVLASYRGYDTLGELAVIFTAGAAVLTLIGRGRRRPGRAPGDPRP
ncbi:MAG: DUF4040 domain-containing protein [Gammaproteobacteria bacterium]|nr:DUF4040 domain-containing protein [Gammaproteobacteria bacterium]MDD9824802.1 DUF4040 domain-containing protein [Gammaproteobacteria bacterium]MDD9864329.1 DUF4040 domain-containing protein [Gammaproteobacteria bacterium]